MAAEREAIAGAGAGAAADGRAGTRVDGGGRGGAAGRRGGAVQAAASAPRGSYSEGEETLGGYGGRRRNARGALIGIRQEEGQGEEESQYDY